MKFIFDLREKIGLGLNKQDALEKVICENVVREFLKKHPTFDVRSHNYPFDSYSMFDAREFSSKEDGVDFYILLHGKYYYKADDEVRIQRFFGKNKVIIYTAKFDPLNPHFENIIGQDYQWMRFFNH